MSGAGLIVNIGCNCGWLVLFSTNRSTGPFMEKTKPQDLRVVRARTLPAQPLDYDAVPSKPVMTEKDLGVIRFRLLRFDPQERVLLIDLVELRCD